MWDERYKAPGYLFGTQPAEFLIKQAGHLPKGAKVLCLGDGEGRNSVYLAGLGCHVTAFDSAAVAVDKAHELAAQRGVSVDFNLCGVEDWDWSRQYDAVVAIFVQFAGPDLRKRMFDWMQKAVVPGGLILLHGYVPRQLKYGTGGPSVVENMYTEQILRDAFDGCEIIRLHEYDAEIEEGTRHSGTSALIDLVARKPV